MVYRLIASGTTGSNGLGTPCCKHVTGSKPKVSP